MKRERITENRETRRIRRASDEARAYTKRKAKKTNIIISVVALSLVAVVAAGIVFFSSNAMKNNVKSSETPTTAVTKVVDTKASAKTSETAAKQTPTQAPAAAQKNTGSQAAVKQTNTQPAQNNNTAAKTANTNTKPAAQTQAAKDSENNIKTVNGERIYQDTKHQAPAKTGTPLHYYANGKTSYGFDWTYKTDNNIVSVSCNYNFNTQQYDFSIYGAAPGTAHITLYYNTADNVQVPVPMTVTVDSSLNVTQG